VSQRLNELEACELARRLAQGQVTAEAVVRASIERVEAREKDIGAWAHFDAQQAIAAARVLDQGPVCGPRKWVYRTPLDSRRCR
jgi:Asp-tRNA(Asn)/Glu-tRNA(Gln) amidotransferase A subunit family amidase